MDLMTAPYSMKQRTDQMNESKFFFYNEYTEHFFLTLCVHAQLIVSISFIIFGAAQCATVLHLAWLIMIDEASWRD